MALKSSFQRSVFIVGCGTYANSDMIIVRVPDSGAAVPEYLFSNATVDVSDPAYAEKALKSSCSGELFSSIVITAQRDQWDIS